MNLLEILGKIGFDWQVALANLVNFLIIVWLLQRFAFKPIQRVIAKRQEKIKEGLDQAQAAETALLQARGQAETAVKEARLEANDIVQEAHNRSQAMITDAATEATEKGRAIVQSAEVAAEKAKEQSLQLFRQEAASLVVEGVEQVLRKEMTEDLHARISKSGLAALKA